MNRDEMNHTEYKYVQFAVFAELICWIKKRSS